MSTTRRRRRERRGRAAADASDTPERRRIFRQVRRAEEQYSRGLKGIAQHIGHLARGFTPGDPDQMNMLQSILRGYAVIVKPWAVTHARRMLEDVKRRDTSVWATMARQMSRALKDEIETAPTGALMNALLDEQVALITSLPIEAAERVHKLTVEGLTNATRAKEIAAEILNSGDVTRSRAMLIARTEVARTASLLTQARAQHVGSEGYIWRTAEDADVRKEHRVLNGQFIRWMEPPIAAADGTRAHAGQIYNCRCYPEPVLADEG